MKKKKSARKGILDRRAEKRAGERRRPGVRVDRSIPDQELAVSIFKDLFRENTPRPG